MGKAHNKARRQKDKYYHLAKEQGYRARSAFKLIQLNQKLDFLATSHVLLDLCAAPGGWLQVAVKYMPTGSTIIGVDLAAIRPIRGCITHVEDITTPQCRAVLKRDLGGKRADVVLHDGAPNVGTSWTKDAFGQNELTLSALHLATDFLRRGGTFVTKVFRSADYNSLLWVFHQLFGRVEATKPHSSREQSAEIFIVCRDYKAPDKLDPRLLDAKYVFKEVDDLVGSATGVAGGGGGHAVDVFHKKSGEGQRVRQREGYDESLGPLLTRVVPVSEFLRHVDPVRLLTQASSFTFDAEATAAGLLTHAATREELLEAFKDLKLLGKSEFKAILKWRTAIRKVVPEYGGGKGSSSSSAGEGEEGVEGGEGEGEGEGEEATEEDRAVAEADAALSAAASIELARRKREARREKKSKAAQLRRVRLGLTRTSVDQLETDDDLLGYQAFERLRKGGALEAFAEGEGGSEDEEEEEEEEEEMMQRQGKGKMGEEEEGDDDDDDEEEGEEGEEGEAAAGGSYLASALRAERGAAMDDLEESLEVGYAQALARKERSDGRARAVAESGKLSHGIKLSRREKLLRQATLSEAAMNGKLDLEHTRYLAMLAGARSGEGSDDLLAPDVQAAVRRAAASMREAEMDEEEEEGEEEEEEEGEEGEEGEELELEDTRAAAGGGGGGKAAMSSVAASRWFSRLSGAPEDSAALAAAASSSSGSSSSSSSSSAALLSLAPPPSAAAAAGAPSKGLKRGRAPEAAEAEAVEAEAEAAEPPAPTGRRGSAIVPELPEDGIAEDSFPEWLADVPKSDREKRKDRLRKDRERRERQASRSAKLTGTLDEYGAGSSTGAAAAAARFEVVDGDAAANAAEADAEFDSVLVSKGALSEELARAAPQGGRGSGGSGGAAAAAASGAVASQRKMDLLKAGMGKALMDEEGGGGAGFTVVAGEGAGGAREGSDEESDGSSSGEDSGPDPRDEDYDSDEHAELLALGKMLKRHTTRKALLDASYNRYACAEDPASLPTWFASDERTHHRPQLPITKAQVEAIKARFRDIAARPIHKVAEARARKKRRLGVAMDKAKKTASNIMETEEMGARAKAKAVAKAYRQAEAKKVGAKYVVSGANGSKRGPKGAAAKRGGKTRLVDPSEWHRQAGGAPRLLASPLPYSTTPILTHSTHCAPNTPPLLPQGSRRTSVEPRRLPRASASNSRVCIISLPPLGWAYFSASTALPPPQQWAGRAPL